MHNLGGRHGFGDQMASSDALVEARQNYDSAIDRNLIQYRESRVCQKFEGDRTFPKDPEPSEGMPFGDPGRRLNPPLLQQAQKN
jgi:hypothetical protein